jgi:acyl-CoA synthetase (AMP-forming)/AMP-acid ligase II
MAFEPTTVAAMFAARVAHDSDQQFLLDADGGGLTYREIDDRVDALARALRDEGVSPGDVVGLYLWNDPAWFVSVLATWSIGCVAALCGANSPVIEARRRLALVAPTALVASSDADEIGADRLLSVTPDGALAHRITGPLVPQLHRHEPRPDDSACIFFSSGTTGDAKAIVKTHDALIAAARRTANAYASRGSFRTSVAVGKPPALSFHPFGHAASFGRLVFRLYVGRSVVLLRKFDVDTVAKLVELHGIDTLQLTPAMLHMLAFDGAEHDLGSLRYVTSGTAPLPDSTRQAFEDRYRVPVLQAFGSTEGGVMALERYDDVMAGRRGPGSVGRITPDSEWRIVNPSGHDVVSGDEGELLGRPREQLVTAQGVEPLPLDADGWYHTGDLGRVDEYGILYITGRIKEMLIVGGFNVFPSEIEEVLRESPFVRDAVVVPVSDERLGEMPAAGLVLEPRAMTDRTLRSVVDELIQLTRRELAAYKVPRRWFALDALPLTAVGKLDRRAAAAEAEARAQQPEEIL